MAVEWCYYDKFEPLFDMYLPERGEGETKATQIVTSVCKLIYKWYNDGDVFDNSYVLEGWANDLSDYANWLWEYTDADEILDKIYICYNNSDYENLLQELADKLLDANVLAKMNEEEKVGTIYKCDGKFQFIEDEDEEDWDYEDEDEDEDEEY